MKRTTQWLAMLVTGSLGFALAGCGTRDTAGTSLLGRGIVAINELQPSNQDVIVDEFDEADDWVEIYNPGSDDVDLEGYFVSDDRNEPTKFQLTDEATVPAGEFLLLWADNTPEQGPLHLSFGLSASKGESFVLTSPDGQLVDAVDFGVPDGEQSFARFPDGTGDFAWCSEPTPDAPNGDACGEP